MHFSCLELLQFRNFEHTAVQFSPHVNILLGINGQGKTNLMEALYLLCRGSSFRAANNQSLIRLGSAGPAHIKATIQKDQREFQTHLVLSASRKDYTVNGKKASSTQLERNFPLVLFSPESLSVIKEGPEQRRAFLDEMLGALGPQNARSISDFKQILRTRNRVLRDHLKGVYDKRQCQLLLESLEAAFLDAAAHLTWTRLEALRALQADFEEAMRFISGRSDADISVDYLISDQSAHEWSREEVYAALRRRLEELRFRELHGGVSLVGPHKHDIRVLFDGKDSRFYCSQGQQRALILSFKMARIVYHYRVHKFYPFLLLDDVLSELDIEKRANLVVFLKNIRSQIFITTTDFSLPLELDAGSCTVFRVEHGSIE